MIIILLKTRGVWRLGDLGDWEGVGEGGFQFSFYFRKPDLKIKMNPTFSSKIPKSHIWELRNLRCWPSTKNRCFLLKKRKNRSKTWSFVWKIKNRPTCCNFEKKILDIQLHKIFKPIRLLLCNDSICIHIHLYHIAYYY